MLGRADKLLTGRYGAYIAGAFGFACMFSFPAIPIAIGNAATIDASQLMTVALLLLQPTLFFGPSFPIILLTIGPLLQSAFAWHASAGSLPHELITKTVVSNFPNP